MVLERDAENVRHIRKRNTTQEQVEREILDPHQAEGRSYSLEAERSRDIIGTAGSGRLLFVFYTERNGRIHPIHVRNVRRDEPRECEGR